MGCCNNAGPSHDIPKLKTNIKECLAKGNTKQLAFYVAVLNQACKNTFNINTFTFNFDENEDSQMNLLGHCLMSGRVEMFKYVHLTLKADPVIMETYFDKFNMSGLAIICTKNFTGLFDYYSPIYFINKKSQNPIIRIINIKETLQLTSDIMDRMIESIDNEDEHEIHYTPLQRACYFGHIGIIKCALLYTESLENIPKELDIDYIEESTGENCALIACKTWNYNMIRFLHSQTRANFFILNAHKENAIQTLASAAKVKLLSEFFNCLAYLIEKIGIDITYNYQETLLLIDYVKAEDYFIGELKKLNISVNKKEIEKETVGKNQPKAAIKQLETSENFDFIHLFPDLRVRTDSSISAIHSSNENSFNN